MTGRVGFAIRDHRGLLARASELSGGLDAVPKRKPQRFAIRGDVFSLSH